MYIQRTASELQLAFSLLPLRPQVKRVRTFEFWPVLRYNYRHEKDCCCPLLFDTSWLCNVCGTGWVCSPACLWPACCCFPTGICSASCNRCSCSYLGETKLLSLWSLLAWWLVPRSVRWMALLIKSPALRGFSYSKCEFASLHSSQKSSISGNVFRKLTPRRRSCSLKNR